MYLVDTMLVPSAYIYIARAIALGAKHGRTAGRAREAWHHVQYASKKKPRFHSVPFFFPFQPFRSVPFTSVLTVYRGQTVLALGMNSSAKFTACVGEA